MFRHKFIHYKETRIFFTFAAVFLGSNGSIVTLLCLSQRHDVANSLCNHNNVSLHGYYHFIVRKTSRCDHFSFSFTIITSVPKYWCWWFIHVHTKISWILILSKLYTIRRQYSIYFEPYGVIIHLNRLKNTIQMNDHTIGVSLDFKYVTEEAKETSYFAT